MHAVFGRFNTCITPVLAMECKDEAVVSIGANLASLGGTNDAGKRGV